MKTKVTDNRRNFIKKVSLGSAFAALGTQVALSLDPVFGPGKVAPQKVELKLGLQEGVVPRAIKTL